MANCKKDRKNVQKSEEMREKNFQKTVLDRTTPKVGPNPVSRSENGALRLFWGVPFGGLNETKNVKKDTRKGVTCSNAILKKLERIWASF